MLKKTRNLGCSTITVPRALVGASIFIVMLGARDVTSEPRIGDVPLVNHSIFDNLLREHVSHGAVDYYGFQENADELDRYLASLAQVNLDGATRNQKLALYVNAYNAFTIRLILRHLGTIDSIKDIPGRWDKKEWKLAGKMVSLNDIEHNNLRDELNEPRIHFAIVCASTSCPNLAGKAYTESGVDAELDEAARAFMRSPEHVRTEIKEGFFGTSYVLYLSRIFKWFGEDFTDDGKRTVPDFVVRYVDEKDAAFIREHSGELSVRYLDYDWSLNEKKTST